MMDDIDLVRKFVIDSDFPEHIKDALLKCLTLERLGKAETEFDKIIKTMAKELTNEN